VDFAAVSNKTCHSRWQIHKNSLELKHTAHGLNLGSPMELLAGLWTAVQRESICVVWIKWQATLTRMESSLADTVADNSWTNRKHVSRFAETLLTPFWQTYKFMQKRRSIYFSQMKIMTSFEFHSITLMLMQWRLTCWIV